MGNKRVRASTIYVIKPNSPSRNDRHINKCMLAGAGLITGKEKVFLR